MLTQILNKIGKHKKARGGRKCVLDGGCVDINTTKETTTHGECMCCTYLYGEGAMAPLGFKKKNLSCETEAVVGLVLFTVTTG